MILLGLLQNESICENEIHTLLIKFIYLCQSKVLDFWNHRTACLFLFYKHEKKKNKKNN